MDDKGDTRGDLRVPDGALGQQLQKDFEEGKEMLVGDDDDDDDAIY